MLAPGKCLEKAGVWRKLHNVLLDKLRGAGKLDFSRVVANSSSVRAVKGGKVETNSTDQRKEGSH